MPTLQAMTSLDKDYIACHLRKEIDSLQNLLSHIEDSVCFEANYFCEALRLTEIKIRAMRRFLSY